MLTKESFCKALALIQEQEHIDDKVSEALSLVGDGYYLYGSENKFRQALLMVLAETMQDKGDWIDWWLYEDVEKAVWYPDGERVSLERTEELYDYLVGAAE